MLVTSLTLRPRFDENIGCWVGAATRDYVQNLREDVDVYYSTGKFLVSDLPSLQ